MLSPLIPPTLLYWLMVLLLVVATVAGTYLYAVATSRGGFASPGMLFAGVFIAIMIFPALQLGGSLLAFLIVMLFYPERSYSLRRVGKITLWSFVGMSLGLLLMGGCLGVIYVASQVK